MWCEPGDVLLYAKPPNLSTRLIEFGERLEDGPQSKEFYHVALALGRYYKIEADGKTVAINPIDYGKFEKFRPPIPIPHIMSGLQLMHEYVGQPYDWPLIVDDGLRYATHNFVHLPVAYIKDEERRKKICSSLLVRYFKAAEWGPKLTRNASPEDIYLAVKSWPVRGDA